MVELGKAETNGRLTYLKAQLTQAGRSLRWVAARLPAFVDRPRGMPPTCPRGHGGCPATKLRACLLMQKEALQRLQPQCRSLTPRLPCRWCSETRTDQRWTPRRFQSPSQRRSPGQGMEGRGGGAGRRHVRGHANGQAVAGLCSCPGPAGSQRVRWADGHKLHCRLCSLPRMCEPSGRRQRRAPQRRA